MSQQLAEILAKDRIISSAQFTEATTQGKAAGREPVRYLIEKKYISETKLLYYLSSKFGLPAVNISKFEIPADVIRVMSSEQVHRFQAIPIQSNGNTVVLAVCDPTRATQVDAIKLQLKRAVEIVLTSFSAFDQAAEKNFGSAAVVGDAIAKYTREESKKDPAKETGTLEFDTNQVHEIDVHKTVQTDAPVIALVNGILNECIKRAASDIHVEPYEKRFRVRMRVDGVLLETAQIPLEMKRAVIARLKILARLDIAESRVPQDGRIKLKMGSMEVDFRVNSMPTLFGEKVVLRMLAKGNLALDLNKVGFEPDQLKVFKKCIYSANGMVLVTGPTGSGKTTTLYSALAELNVISDNISTAEDPVEYNLEGINQVQVNKEVGLTFASVLRALLRQDPDTVLVGEIRDYETAEVAIQAAMTGHLVLSTLHTNDAPGTIVRLTNMGVEPFLVVASLNGVLAQRLLRKVCADCKAPQQIPKEQLKEIGLDPDGSYRFLKGKGCPTCNNSGYKGRSAIYEVLDFTSSLKEMVLKGESIIEIKKQAIKEGMKTLRMSALSRASEGVTTLEEALASTMEG